ncbi:MAG: UDP-N-acetylglucosamine 2-epimerase (non-hydrolyzing) [Sulfurimonas sp.]|jgi:UDP-N-acetylglucosamine 2-epimerase (non-hydrolysing)|uniref:non-hydrolyzing UDP-N-acetylglucosamine 2-epimerase n=1 Tax=Sulfurimonas sp. TaxID=2022749 RepID=UPI002A3E85E9|nr:UDP-N-acetylglucosamine 2-epimerase (non-hydrolyzing) [Dehalococcoidales bacterium]
MIIIIYGTRPEYIKVKPVADELRKREIPFRLLCTGQHTDSVMLPDTLNVPVMEEGFNRLDSITRSVCSDSFHKVFEEIKPDAVMVQGDTASAMAAALTAFHHGIKVIHLEAGLRTYDPANPYPEEVYRRIISVIASVHLCPTEHAADCLKKERVTGQIFVTGNTVLDGIADYRELTWYGNTVVVTLHRRENHKEMASWFRAVNRLAQENPHLNFILPLHPNPEVSKHRDILTDVSVVPPMTRHELLTRMTESVIVITDSGGIQEECSFLNKKCLVCRKVTERPEAVGTSSFMVTGPEQLREVFMREIRSFAISFPCPFGDGHASERIADLL